MIKILFILKELLIGIFQFLKQIWFVWAFGLMINLSFWGFRKYKDIQARLNIAQLIDEAYIATAKREKLIEELGTAQEALIGANEKIINQSELIIDQKKQLENKDKQLENKDKQLENKDKQLENKDKQLENKDKQIKDQSEALKDQEKTIAFLIDQCTELKKLAQKS